MINSPLSMIEIESLHFEVSQNHILRGVDLSLQAGESMTIIGPNGAGKSTLLKAIVGLLNPKNMQGEIFLAARNAKHLSYRERGRLLSFVPQRPIFPPRMKLLDYVLLGRTPHMSTFDMSFFGAQSKEDMDAACYALEQTEMAWAAERFLQTLSGGETQLAAIARSIATKSPILLLDEPTSSLDLGHSINLCSFIARLAKENNIAVVLTMHNLQLAGQYGDKMALLSEGRICAEGTTAEVITAENILKYYGVSAEIINRDGGVFMLPNYAPNYTPNYD